MKLKTSLPFAFLFLLLLTSCGEGTPESNNSGETSAPETVENSASDAPGAVSTWDGHSLRDTPGSKGKWMASVKFGESMELLGETEESGGKTYSKARLLDGKEGWVRKDLIHEGGKMGAMTKLAEVYLRPSISNISDKMTEYADLVVIKQVKDEFTEFIAKNDKSNNRVRGWVLGNVITTDEIDLAVAVMISRAEGESNPKKRIELLNPIVSNGRYDNSVFRGFAQEMIDASGEKAVELETLREDQLSVIGNNVNVRDQPNVDSSTKLFQMFDGEIATILEKGELDEIGGTTDYWYKVKSSNGNEGWVFGKFTNRAR